MEIRALGEHAKMKTNRRKFREVFLWVDRALIYGGEARVQGYKDVLYVRGKAYI